MSKRNYVLNGVPSDEFHVTYVDKLQAENAKLKAERDTAVKEMIEQSKQHGYARAEIDRLREALEWLQENIDSAYTIENIEKAKTLQEQSESNKGEDDE